MASPNEPAPTTGSWWTPPVLSYVTATAKSVAQGLGRAVGVYQPEKFSLAQLGMFAPRPICIEDCQVAPCSYAGVKTHILQQLDNEKDAEDAQNASNIDQLRRGVINNSKALLEDDNMQGINIHLLNFGTSFDPFPEDQLLETWTEFSKKSRRMCAECQVLVENDDTVGLLKKIPELKKVFTDLPSDDLHRTWEGFITSRQRDLKKCNQLLEDGDLSALEKHVKMFNMFSITPPKVATPDGWLEQIKLHEQFISGCKHYFDKGDLARVTEYANANPNIYKDRPGQKLLKQWSDFIQNKMTDVARPVYSDEKFELLELDETKWADHKGYKDLTSKLQLELLTVRSRILIEKENPEDPQAAALKHCADLIEAGDYETLIFEVRNYNFVFNRLIDNFPFDELHEAYLASKGMKPEEFTPKNLGELRQRFEKMSARYADDMNKKTKQFNPNSRVYSQVMACRYLGENQMDRFIDLHQRSHWLQAVVPPAFLECIAQTHAVNQQYDKAFLDYFTLLDKSNRYCARDRLVSTKNACLMQKNSALFCEVDTALHKEFKRIRDEKDDEMMAAHNEVRSLHWNEHDDARLKAAKDAQDIFNSGDWQGMADHLEQKLPETYERLEPLLGRLKNKTEQDISFYWPQIAASRLAITYKACVANGTDQEFLEMCRTGELGDKWDHWTRRLERGQYNHVVTALQEAKGYETDTEARIEAALQKYMPLIQET